MKTVINIVNIMMLKKTPRSEVVSLRLNQARLELLERYRRAFAEELGREVSLSEAAFLALEDRAVGMDRRAARIELLKTPTESLARIRKRWESQHALSAVEWDVLAEYVRIGADEERRQFPIAPSRESYLALLDAFEAIYVNRLEPASRHTWAYFGNLEGFLTEDTLSVTDTEQRHQTVLTQIARRRALLQPTDDWERPGNIGHCFWIAVLEEGVDSTAVDQLLAPYWPVLWRMTASCVCIRSFKYSCSSSGRTVADVLAQREPRRGRGVAQRRARTSRAGAPRTSGPPPPSSVPSATTDFDQARPRASRRPGWASR